jgi:hypothetical protein
LQLHQLLRVSHRQPPQHQRIDQAEDGGIGADAQRQRQHDDKREAWVFGEHPEGISNVSSNLVEQRSMAMGPDPFLRPFDPAEIKDGQATRLGGQHSVAHLSAVAMSTKA